MKIKPQINTRELSVVLNNRSGLMNLVNHQPASQTIPIAQWQK
ncbi:hypothetical protein [Nostoc flagelliforme]|nr:hypothetical protein [Nostoc flagelliforme]